MRVIEVKSCRGCPYRIWGGDGEASLCNHAKSRMFVIMVLTGQEFPRFCPLKEAKDG